MIIADACHLLGRLIIFSKVGFYGQQKIKKVRTKEKKTTLEAIIFVSLYQQKIMKERKPLFPYTSCL